MLKIREFINELNLWRTNFSPYFKVNNGFINLTLTHSIVAFIILPVYTILIFNSTAPEHYAYIGLSYTILFPAYVILCWLIKELRNKLIYFIILHLFTITIISFVKLSENLFQVNELLMFFGLFVICILSIQKLYFLLLYLLFVVFIFLYVIVQIQIDHLVLFTSNIFIISTCSLLILFVKIKLIKSSKGYSRYLEKVIRKTGKGFVLVNLNTEEKIIDFNPNANHLFGIKSTAKKELEDALFNYINKRDLEELNKLVKGKEYKKIIKVNDLRKVKILELKFVLFTINNQNLLLLVINNITIENTKLVDLESSERKYKNLYNKNKSGVFTMDKNSVLLNGNTAFYEILDNCFEKGDVLFSGKLQLDLKEIIDLLGDKELEQNYQTQFKLKNGVEKTLIFNWYLDSHTNLIEGSVVDLTKIQNASLALKQSEEKYRLIYEETNDAILFLDDDKIIDANRKALQLFGVSHMELMESKLFDLSFSISEKTKKKYNEIKENKSNIRSVKFDWIFRGNNSKIEAEVVIIEVTLGKQLFYQCVIKDNTKTNEHIRSIEKNQRNIENILDNHPEGIIICCCLEEVLFTNPEIEKVLGDSISIENLFEEKDQKRFNSIYEQHQKDKERKAIQLYSIDLSGKEILFDITFVSTIFEEKEAVLIIFKDVSIQNKIEREKLRAEIAEESNKKLAIEIKEKIYAEQQLEEQFIRMKSILDSSSSTFLLTLTLDSKISSFNTHCKAYFSNILRKKINEGESFNDYFKKVLSSSRLRFFNKVFNEIKKGRSKQFEIDIEANGIHHWLEVFISPIFNSEGKVSEVSMVAHDISEKKKTSLEIQKSLKEKEVLLKEIHHRVKNNLQVISSILNLQSSFIEDEKTLEILQESRNRVRTMAIIHENLYRTDTFSSINFAGYIHNLTGNLISSYRINEEVLLKKELSDVELVLDQAIPCGLVVNEIITNSLKYAWKKDQIGTIYISLKEENNVVILKIEDDGIGLGFDFNKTITETLGLQLVSTLIEQLDGEINVDTTNGTKYLIKFDKSNS